MIIFPPSIVKNDIDRPVVIFRNKVESAQTNEHIVFPIPQSIQFGDSASYNNSEIGFSGSMILNAGRSQDVTSAFTNVVEQSKAAVPRDMKSLAGLLGSRMTGGGTQSAISVATGTTLNKNIVSEFTGVGTRQFSFQFKLMATTKQETEIIKKICDTFRLGLYPEGNSLQLRYPPTWYINFKKGGAEIAYIPKIFETYLTGMTTNYNSSMNLFHVDGSPVEIDLQLSFMESRALTKTDIETLILRPFEKNDYARPFKMSGDIADTITARNAEIDAEAAAAKAKSTSNQTT